jgi:hypothetical protein
MMQLNQKNYNRLPEVVQKAKEKEKEQQFKHRQEKVREMDKVPLTIIHI